MEKKLSLSKKVAFLIMSTSLVSASSAMEGPGVRRLINDNGGENIMHVNIESSIQTVYNLVPNFSNIQVNQYFEEVKRFITNYRGNDIRDLNADDLPKSGEFPNGLSRSKRVNALRALENNRFSQNARDYDPISANEGCTYVNNNTIIWGTKDLLARVWSIILRTNGTDKTNLETALFNNLNEVIENDGHRTCYKGKSARLLKTLQGYIPGINIDTEIAAPIDWCNHYETKFYQTMSDEDPLKVILGLEMPKNFSFQDLINRLAAERGDVLIKINGYYGSNTPQARAAIQKMEERFWRTAESYIDIAIADKLLASNEKRGALEDYDLSIRNLSAQQERALNRRHQQRDIPSGFDHQFYLGNAPLLTQSVQGQTQEQRHRAAEEHYINHGRAEGRPYNRPIQTQTVVPTDFDHQFYLGNAPRLTQSVQGQTQEQRYRAAEEHYINHGRAEGRPYRR